MEQWPQANPAWLKDTDFLNGELVAVITELVMDGKDLCAVLRTPSGAVRSLTLYRDNQQALKEKYGLPSDCIGKTIKLQLTHAVNKAGKTVSYKSII